MYFPSSKGMGSPGSGDKGGSTAAAAPAGKDASGVNISGSFDPSALERGAKALKDMDSSPNATKAFEITKLQEQTKQKELQSQMEQSKTAREQVSLQKAQIEGEERRKTADHTQDQERRTMQYKAQLESELYQKKLEDQQQQNEQWLRQQHEQFLQQEQMRKQTEKELEESRMRTIEHQAQLQRQLEMEKAMAQGEAEIKKERDNVDIHLRTMRAKASEERKTKMEQLGLIFGSLGSGFNALLEDKTKMTSLAVGLAACAVGIYGARSGTKVAGNLLEKKLGRPPLVRETSKWNISQGFTGIMNRFTQPAGVKNMYDKIVLHEELAERLQWTSNSLINAKKNGTPYRHLLLHGPPGTGKTLFARTLAKQSGLDYAIMSGGDVGPLGKDAVDEVNKLFNWANNSKKGLILFVDEAEAFLRTGRSSSTGMSEDMRNVLSSFLHHTGTESDKFMVVLATNERDVIFFINLFLNFF